MLRRSVSRLQHQFVTRATRLQLGNVKSQYGNLQTAAGSHEKWGYMYRGWKYPILAHMAGGFSLLIGQICMGFWNQYRDMVILADHICYEDVKDRCLIPIPGWGRLKGTRIAAPGGFATYRDPTPLEWLPFEIKLGQVKQASY